MTRNEWIAARFGRWVDNAKTWQFVIDNESETIVAIGQSCDSLEAAGCAPWQSAPPLTDAAAKVVEAACAWAEWIGVPCSTKSTALTDAVRAYKESVK